MMNIFVWNKTVYLYKNKYGIIYHTNADMP